MLPVLERITDTYQEYSNRDNANSINNALKFVNEQLAIIKKRQQISQIENLMHLNLLMALAMKLVQSIQHYLTHFHHHCLDLLKNIDPLSELAAINKELTRNRQFFTENDPSIQRLQKTPGNSSIYRSNRWRIDFHCKRRIKKTQS